MQETGEQDTLSHGQHALGKPNQGCPLHSLCSAPSGSRLFLLSLSCTFSLPLFSDMPTTCLTLLTLGEGEGMVHKRWGEKGTLFQKLWFKGLEFFTEHLTILYEA